MILCLGSSEAGSAGCGGDRDGGGGATLRRIASPVGGHKLVVGGSQEIPQKKHGRKVRKTTRGYLHLWFLTCLFQHLFGWYVKDWQKNGSSHIPVLPMPVETRVTFSTCFRSTHSVALGGKSLHTVDLSILQLRVRYLHLFRGVTVLVDGL